MSNPRYLVLINMSNQYLVGSDNMFDPNLVRLGMNVKPKYLEFDIVFIVVVVVVEVNMGQTCF